MNPYTELLAADLAAFVFAGGLGAALAARGNLTVILRRKPQPKTKPGDPAPDNARSKRPIAERIRVP
jgi:hypothetical protein